MSVGATRLIYRPGSNEPREVRLIACCYCGLRRIDPRDRKRAGRSIVGCTGKPRYGVVPGPRPFLI